MFDALYLAFCAAAWGIVAYKVRAWLRDRPTKARPPSRGERVRRFVRNNVVAVAALIVREMRVAPAAVVQAAPEQPG